MKSLSIKKEEGFRKIKSDIDVKPFMYELNAFLEYGGEWDALRSTIPCQKYTKNIELRRFVLPLKKMEKMSKVEKKHFAGTVEYHELVSKNYPSFQKTYNFLEDFADTLGSQITRAQIVAIKPGMGVAEHVDAGKYYETKYRLHLPIQTKGSRNVCDGMEQVFHEGEIWWMDYSRPHAVFNDHNEERIQIIFDILPKPRNLLRKGRDFAEKKAALFKD